MNNSNIANSVALSITLPTETLNIVAGVMATKRMKRSQAIDYLIKQAIKLTKEKVRETQKKEREQAKYDRKVEETAYEKVMKKYGEKNEDKTEQRQD